LKEKFGAHGEIGDVYIPRSYGSTDSRGYAFVRFMDKKDAEDAQRVLDGTDLDGRVIKIQEARERRPDNPRDAMASRG
jgi:RNA recognition motif-containing protein